MSKAFFNNFEKDLKKMYVLGFLISEILNVVFENLEKYNEIITEAILRTVDKNPDIFKEALEEVEKEHASVQEKDNSTNVL